jgi:ribonuclease-3
MTNKKNKARSFRELENALGYQFSDNSLLERALTHTSAKKGRVGDNERLEFLGDRVLGLVVADGLWLRFPNETEGDLAKRHADLVKGAAVAEVASTLKIGSALSLSKGERDSGGHQNPHLLADACEAIIAAIYLDGGYLAAKKVVSALWEELIIAQTVPPRDPKTLLQEWVQAKGQPLPAYKILSRDGPSHDPFFTMSVFIEGYQPTIGTGKSKRVAEQDAAKKMLDKLNGNEDN